MLERLDGQDESDILRENWDMFVDSNFSQFNSRIHGLMKKNIGYPCDGFPGIVLERDVLSITAELGKIIDAPRDESKRELYRHQTQVGFATAKYIKLCEFWRLNGIRLDSDTREWNNIDRSELTNFFLESYRRLEIKDARKFVDLVVQGKGTGLIDEDFWEKVGGVRKTCKPENVWNFLETIYTLSESIDMDERIFNEKRGDKDYVQNSFTDSFIKVDTKVDPKHTPAFCRGVKKLFLMNKNNFDEYATQTINISDSIPGQMGFWAIYDAALLEREDIDFTGNQFVNDILSIKKVFGEKTAWVYMMGMAGSIKNKPTKTVSELHKSLSYATSKLSDLGWYENELKKIKESNNDDYRKEMLVDYLDLEIGILKHRRDCFIPQQMEDYPKIDPLLFRSMYKDIINNFGLSEAYLFAKFWNNGFLFYFDGRKSDLKVVLEFPELLKDFKQTVSEKVYKRTMYTVGKMANLGTRISLKIINDVMECYADKGEKVTLGRIGYTYGLYYLRKGYMRHDLGRIDGLEKTEGDIYKRRKTK